MTFNSLHCLPSCLDRLQAEAKGSAHTIIVDNGSEIPPSTDDLPQLGVLQVILNETNRGFSAATIIPTASAMHIIITLVLTCLTNRVVVSIFVSAVVLACVGADTLGAASPAMTTGKGLGNARCRLSERKLRNAYKSGKYPSRP